MQRGDEEENTSVSVGAPGTYAMKWVWQPHGPPVDSVPRPKELDVRGIGGNRVNVERDLLFFSIPCNPQYFRALTLLTSEIPSALCK